MRAIKKAPTAEKSHPNKLTLPNEAIAVGTRKTPEPIILPTTSEVLVQMPNLFLDAFAIKKKRCLFKVIPEAYKYIDFG